VWMTTQRSAGHRRKSSFPITWTDDHQWPKW
jgi:hypothetical protein